MQGSKKKGRTAQVWNEGLWDITGYTELMLYNTAHLLNEIIPVTMILRCGECGYDERMIFMPRRAECRHPCRQMKKLQR